MSCLGGDGGRTPPEGLDDEKQMQNYNFLRLYMLLMENNIHINSFHGAHPTHESSLVDMQLIPPKRFWYLYGSRSFTMSIIVVPRK